MARNYNLKYRRGDDFVALSHREIENTKQAHIERPSVRPCNWVFVCMEKKNCYCWWILKLMNIFAFHAFQKCSVEVHHFREVLLTSNHSTNGFNTIPSPSIEMFTSFNCKAHRFFLCARFSIDREEILTKIYRYEEGGAKGTVK